MAKQIACWMWAWSGSCCSPPGGWAAATGQVLLLVVDMVLLLLDMVLLVVGVYELSMVLLVMEWLCYCWVWS